MKRTLAKIILTNSTQIILVWLILLSACMPKEQIVFKNIKNIVVEVGDDGHPRLTAKIFFYNPNKVTMKLKEINVEVLLDGEKSAEVNRKFDLMIPAESDFSVPIEGKLTLKQVGFLDTVVGLLDGKKYEALFKGYIRINVRGITIKVPISQKQELKLTL